ncbi:MAG: hypothetical protein GF331_27340 [Chitinivibrionales bacterium]|nr:hypothetical protein [Chitinivibrionales bacterium]
MFPTMATSRHPLQPSTIRVSFPSTAEISSWTPLRNCPWPSLIAPQSPGDWNIGQHREHHPAAHILSVSVRAQDTRAETGDSAIHSRPFEPTEAIMRASRTTGLAAILLCTLLAFPGAAQQDAGAGEYRNIAVLDLQSQGGLSESEAALLSEELRVHMHKSKRFTVIERGQMAAILREQGFQQTGCTTDACAVEMGQLLGVHAMLAGSIGRLGSYYVMNVRAIDVSTGVVVASESEKVKGGIDAVLEEGVGAISVKLITGLSAETTAEAETVTTPTGTEVTEEDEEAGDTGADRKRRRRRVLIPVLAGTGVGAAVAVIAIMASGDDESLPTDEPQTTPNTTVTF